MFFRVSQHNLYIFAICVCVLLSFVMRKTMSCYLFALLSSAEAGSIDVFVTDSQSDATSCLTHSVFVVDWVLCADCEQQVESSLVR